MVLAVTGRWRGVPGGARRARGAGLPGARHPAVWGCGVRGERAAQGCRRAGSRADVSALLGRNGEHHAGRCWQAQAAQMCWEEGGAVLAHPDARGPIYKRPRARRLAARFGITYAMGCGQRRGAAAEVLVGNWMAMGWTHRLRMWAMCAWRAWPRGWECRWGSL